MSLKMTSIFFMVIVVVIMSTTDGRTCFTMPPKITEISELQSYNIPNFNSESYEHNTHICPHGYVKEFAYSYLTREYDKGVSIYKINSYVVCCNGGVLYAMKVLFS